MKPCNYCAKRHPVYVSCKEHEQAQNKEHVNPSKSNENDSQSKPEPQNPKPVKASTNCAKLDPKAPERSARWKSNNRAKYNEYMREYMRKRRHDNN